MKKLLFFASDYNIGLSELLLDELEAIHKANIPYIAVAGSNEQVQGLWQRAFNNNLNITRIDGLDEHHNSKSLKNTLKRLIIENEVSCIHVQNNWQLFLSNYARISCPRDKGRKISIVYTLHGFRNNHPLKSKIAKLIIGTALLIGADKIQCMTQKLKKEFALLSYKIKVLPLGISDACFIDTPNPDISNGLQIIYPALFREGKNQDLIIKAFSKFLKNDKSERSRLILPGDGDLLDHCKKLAKETGIENHVCFPGRITRDEVFQYISKSNVAIIASSSETFGQCIVEPFVMGRCVVSTPIGIAPEIIGKNNGYIFNNEADLIEILNKMNQNKQSIITMGENNRTQGLAFKWNAIIETYRKKLYSC